MIVKLLLMFILSILLTIQYDWVSFNFELFSIIIAVIVISFLTLSGILLWQIIEVSLIKIFVDRKYLKELRKKLAIVNKNDKF